MHHWDAACVLSLPGLLSFRDNCSNSGYRIFIDKPLSPLTHWGRVTHICVSELTIIGSDNGLSPGRRQAIIWNNAGLLLIEPLGTNFSEISIGIQTFSFKKMHLNMSSAKWRPFCPGLNVLTQYIHVTQQCCTNFTHYLCHGLSPDKNRDLPTDCLNQRWPIKNKIQGKFSG